MKLLLATELEKVERDRACYAAWGQRLSMEQWLARERRLRAHRWSRGAMQTWFLRDDVGATLASCETFRMISRADSDGFTYGVASVFTEERWRGHGYATEMMKRLNERLRSDDSRTHAAILFSDVGGALYAREGYVARPSFDWTFKPASGDPGNGVDSLIVESEVAEALEVAAIPPDRFQVLPSAEQIDWHLERERIYAELLGRRRPQSQGARIGSSVILWAQNLKVDELQVLLLRSGSSVEAQRLLWCARRIAASAGIGCVRHWETESDRKWDLAKAEGVGEERDGGLSMICSFSPKVRAEEWKTIPRVLWV